MDREFPVDPYSLASPPPENLLDPPCQRFLSTENHLPIPSVANQAIESAFSRLTLSPSSRPYSETPSLLAFPATTDAVSWAESLPPAMDSGERSPPFIWAQSPSSNGGVSGPFGFSRAHQNTVVGPEAVSSFGVSPNLDTGDPLKRLKYSRRRDFYSATSDTLGCSSLYCTKPLSRKANVHLPVSPSARRNNTCNARPSFLYSNQQLYQWQQGLTLENMRGRIVTLTTEQAWSAVLLSKLEQGLGEEEIEMVLSEVMNVLGDLMRNQLGGNFVLKLFEACNEDQRTRIVMSLTEFPFKLISICLNSNGAKAMQKLLEKLITPQIPFVVSALSLGAIALATDPYGQHVIQYCVKRFPPRYIKCLFNEIGDNCFKVASNKSGCCVLQSCVEHSDGEAREQLIRKIKANALHLAEDPYGNYVVQHLLGMKMPEVTADLLRQFQGYFVSLSCNKYASNVVEKFLLESGENHSAKIIMELLTTSNASMLLTDPYGNFVIQSSLFASKGHIRDALLNFIQANAPSMISNIYGRKILARFEKKKLHSA